MDAIDALKQKVLTLAIQGKLVPQNPSDEPASELLKKIKAEKKALVNAGKIKKDKKESYIYKGADNNYYEKIGSETKDITDEIPFEIPENWEWVKIKCLCDTYTGNSISENVKKSKYTNISCGFNYIGTKDVGFDNTITYENGVKIPYNEEKFRFAYPEDILLCIEGGSAGRKIAILSQKVCFGNKLCNFHQYLNQTRFLYYFLQSPYFFDMFKENISGIIGGVSINKIKELLIPLPPLSEQERIVNEIEKIFSEIDVVKKNQEELSKLKDGLKSKILDLAIKGKLVEQDPNDEPASVLLEKIKAEKAELVKQGKIKKDKHESYIFKGADNRHYEQIGSEVRDITEEIPFDIPENWEWVRLGSISKYIQRGKSPKYSEIMKIPVISQKCNKWEIFDIKQAKFIQEDSLSSYSEDRLLIDGDILWNSTGTGTVGRLAIYYDKLNPYKIAVADSHVTVIRLCSVNSQYIYYYLSSPQVQIGIEDICDGSTNQKELSLTSVKEYLIPIPSVKEQERIVAKIKQINNYIENL